MVLFQSHEISHCQDCLKYIITSNIERIATIQNNSIIPSKTTKSDNKFINFKTNRTEQTLDLVCTWVNIYFDINMWRPSLLPRFVMLMTVTMTPCGHNIKYYTQQAFVTTTVKKLTIVWKCHVHIKIIQQLWIVKILIMMRVHSFLSSIYSRLPNSQRPRIGHETIFPSPFP